jgi:excisionase family DNA binding protein
LNKTDSKDEVSAVEAARRLGVGLDYIYSLLWTGKLSGRKVGRVWRVPIQAINERRKAVATPRNWGPLRTREVG